MRLVIAMTFALGVLTPALAAAQVSGEAVYQQRCAVCHDSGNPRIPSRDQVKKLSVARILRTLDFGEMQNVASKLLQDDFRCRSCGSEFEALVRSSDLPHCPSCKSTKLEQLPSMFAVSSVELTKSKVRTAKKERRRSRAYRDEITFKRETKHHD